MGTPLREKIPYVASNQRLAHPCVPRMYFMDRQIDIAELRLLAVELLANHTWNSHRSTSQTGL